jgi:glycerol-3-phosphate dehydrogenase
MNIPIRPCGSLVCQWPWDLEDRLEEVLKESHDAGDSHAAILSPDQLQSARTNLNTSAVGAVHIPGEVVLDPWLYSIAWPFTRKWRSHFFTNFGMDPEASSLMENCGR